MIELVRLLTDRSPAELAAVRGELEKLATTGPVARDPPARVRLPDHRRWIRRIRAWTAGVTITPGLCAISWARCP